MLGSDASSAPLLSYVDLEQRVPAKHPARAIEASADDVRVALDARFERFGERAGRQSIASEPSLQASLP